MAVKHKASLALSLGTLLLLICGIELSSSIVGAAALASAANTAQTGGTGATTSCVENPDQPKCSPGESSDSSSSQDDSCESTSEDGECASPLPAKKERSASAADAEATASGVGSAPYQNFHVGDVIELFNTESQDIQIVFPSLVAGDNPMGGGYHITKTTDGTEVKNIPDRFLHHYIPYKIGSEVLCNIGDFKARPMIVKCTVLAYDATVTKGAKVLQNEYSVKVHQTKANDEFEATLPVWKMQRRFVMMGQW